ncbi:MAG: sigma-54 dependent transcriptional regulator [Thermodesulfobacteriota bacterium]
MTPAKRVLVVDNEEGFCRLAEAVLGDEGCAVTSYTRSFEALEAFAPGRYDLVVTDIRMPGVDGLGLLERVRQADPSVPVIVITAFATVELSIQALRGGAHDMLTKPFEAEEFVYRVRNALRHAELAAENRALRAELAGRSSFAAVVGESAALLAVLDTARRVALRDFPVLLTGEPGTGKELVARAIHDHSPRRDGAFVPVNASALPAEVLQRELFGCAGGAFPGGARPQRGLLELADRGTLFLDDVDGLPAACQDALLRFLGEGQLYRAGESVPRSADVRILSAARGPLGEVVAAGAFRKDLCYGLCVATLHLPPLRDRPEDVPLLCARFLREHNQAFGTRVTGLTREALGLAGRHPWPGNVRQLGNALAAAVAVVGEGRIDAPTLSQFSSLDGHRPAPLHDLDLSVALARFEAQHLGRVLRWAGGDVDAASRALGLDPAESRLRFAQHGLGIAGGT